MKKVLFKVFKSLFLLLFFICVLDILFGKMFSTALYNSPDGRYYKTIQSLERSTADILMIGSSKAETNFMPKVFKNRLNLSCWNAGRGGQGLLFFRSIQEATLKRYTPKILILNLSEDELENILDIDRLAILKPFYWKHPEIRSILNRKSRHEKYFNYSNLYRYNSMFYFLFRSYVKKGLDGDISMNGMKPRIGEMKLDTKIDYRKDIYRNSRPINKEAINELEVLLKSFNEAGTKIYVVISPELQSSSRTISMDILEELAEKYEFEIFDFFRDSTFIGKPELFKDFYHLNIDGAELLSNKIVKRIQKRN